jgi:hypothetical protein
MVPPGPTLPPPFHFGRLIRGDLREGALCCLGRTGMTGPRCVHEASARGRVHPGGFLGWWGGQGAVTPGVSVAASTRQAVRVAASGSAC